jgi:preprotein translocase subunit SecE
LSELKMIKKVKEFLRDSWFEVKKVVFPNRDEVIGSTKVVIVAVLMVAVFLGVVDIFLSKLVAYLFKY